MRRVRRALATAAVVAAGAGVAYVAYQWWLAPPSDAYYDSVAAAAADEDDVAAEAPPTASDGEPAPPSLPPRHPAPAAAEVELAAAAASRRRPEPAVNSGTQSPPPPPPPPPLDPLAAKAAADLEKHYASVQSVADAVTLPTTLAAVAAAVRADADLEAMAAALRSGSARGDAKVAAWSALRVAALERLVAAPWLLAAAAATTRAGVNVLGRRLFVAAQLGGARPPPRAPGAPPAPPPTVPKTAQERFLEFNQAVATRAAAGLRDIVAAAVRGVTAVHADLANLAAPIPVGALLDALSDAHAAVERGVATAGWRAILLPPVADADRFFADAAAEAAEDDSVDGCDPATVDAMARAMAGELAAVVEGGAFADAARAAAAAAATETAAAVSDALGGAGGAPLPLARIIPRATAVGDGLLDGDSAVGRAAIGRVAQVGEVDALSAAVYSSGGEGES